MNTNHAYKRQLLPIERRPFHAPNANVVLNARVLGAVSEETLRAAAKKMQQRHRLLGARVAMGEDDAAWFTSEGAGDFPVKVFPRRSDDHWIEKCLEEYRIPHAFDQHAPIRFILLHAPDVSDLVILCHHMICDAMSLAYLMRDVLNHLGDSAREVEVLPDPPLACADNIPIGRDTAPRPFIEKLNAEASSVRFDEEDYRNICAAYWDHSTPRAYALEFTEAQTSRLAARCRDEQVTVNTALLAALAAAQYQVQGGDEPYLHQIASAMNIRQHLIKTPGESFGFYAGGTLLTFPYPADRIFWDAARALHHELKTQLTPETVLGRILAIGDMAPALHDALHFKRYGKLVQPHQSRYEKLSAFAARDDALASFIESTHKEDVQVGVVLSNLTRLDMPRRYGGLALDKVMFLGAGTRSYQKAAGVVTASGKLTVMLSHLEEAIDLHTMAHFRDALLGILQTEVGI